MGSCTGTSTPCKGPRGGSPGRGGAGGGGETRRGRARGGAWGPGDAARVAPTCCRSCCQHPARPRPRPLPRPPRSPSPPGHRPAGSAAARSQAVAPHPRVPGVRRVWRTAAARSRGAAPALELQPDPIRRERFGRFRCGVRKRGWGHARRALWEERCCDGCGGGRASCAQRTGRQRQRSGYRENTGPLHCGVSLIIMLVFDCPAT